MVVVSDREIEVVNDALAMLGHPAIHSLDGSSPAAEYAERLYPLTLKTLLSCYNWTFAKKQTQLTRSAINPVVKYNYAHSLPNDRGGMPTHFYSDVHGSSIRDWEIVGDEVYSQSEIVFCDYVKDGAFSGCFRNLLTTAVAAKLAWPLMGDKSLTDRFHQEAFGTPSEAGRGGLFKNAMSDDARGAPARGLAIIHPGPLVEAMLS